MASDGNIDKREVELIKSMCEKSPLFKELNFDEEINLLVKKLNDRGKEFISYYFNLLQNASLTEEEELTLIDFAFNTIKADEQIEYSEIKFFKVIRKSLGISDHKILEKYPELEEYLEEDINTEALLERLTENYLDFLELPTFSEISIQKNK
jgi:uncharacterized tellurite resistance protein B-like protein